MLNRPAPTADLTEEEFLRWYWLRAELAALARSLAVPTSGAKDVLAARIAARLGGRVQEEAPAVRVPVARLTGPLDRETVIPPGQRCSQLLRAWFVGEIGSSFRFDAAMRDFFASTDGTQTLGDALAHWASSRTDEPKAIEAQFEYNRFARAWHQSHPGAGNGARLRDAWRTYRDAPIGARARS